ncbi:MAG: hypothetical protein K8S18_02870, partial [Desulfobacula sp.]|nr:hypothetical protein [Desulfobacula sp.]
MKTQRILVIVWTMLFFTITNSIYTQCSCKEILKDGVFNTESYKKNILIKKYIAYKISGMDQGEATEYLHGQGITQIFGIPIGGSYTNAQFKDWQREFNEQYQESSSYELNESILLSSADSKIVDAWSKCIAQNGGFYVTLKQNSETEILAEIQWYPYLGSNKLKIIGFTLDGAEDNENELKSLKNKKMGPKEKIIIPLKRIEKQAITLTIKTNLTEEVAYLPALKEIPEIPTGSYVYYDSHHETFGSGIAFIKYGSEYKIYYGNPQEGNQNTSTTKCTLSTDGLVS